MFKRTARHLLLWTMLVIATLNVEVVTQSFKADRWLGSILQRGPDFFYGLYLFAQQKWVVIIVAFYFGVVCHNWFAGYAGRVALRHGRVPLWLVRRRIGGILCKIDGRMMTTLMNLGRELRTLNDELVSPGLAFPPLPTVDPHNAPGMELTKSYLISVKPFMTARDLHHARKLATAVLLHRIA